MCARRGGYFCCGNKSVWCAQPEIRHHQDAEDCVRQRPWTRRPEDLTARLFLRHFRRLDEFPEFWIFLKRLIFADLDAGTEEKILERVPAQDAVDEHAELVAFKINAVVADAK